MSYLAQMIDRELNCLYDEFGDELIGIDEYWNILIRVAAAYKKLQHLIPKSVQADLDAKFTHCYLTYLGVKCYHPMTVDKLLELTSAERVCLN